MNIKSERTRISLKTKKSKDITIVFNNDDDDEDTLKEVNDNYNIQVKFEVKDPLTISTSIIISRPQSILPLSTLSLSTMTEVLECDSKT
jgi:hypothetical protein